jgi:hypothetical protein
MIVSGLLVFKLRYFLCETFLAINQHSINQLFELFLGVLIPFWGFVSNTL